ncbi:MAG: ribulose-1,5-biphosphate synthetase [Lentisphaerae bacterium ADurb.Bin242]|nr:MAG: ribulose-1,5-biphosphate synthetase [Lentisphaerae bacterium ADurb.Bin242]
MNSGTSQIDFGELPVIQKADVVVVGGGPGGLGAAVMAARNGAKTLLIERYGLPGGMASVGEVQPFMPNHLNGEESFDRPVFTEWRDRMANYMPETWKGSKIRETLLLHPGAAALAAEELLLDAGVGLLYHHTLVGTVVADRKIERIVLHAKGGFVAAEGKIFVDCTGDGDLAALAGCSFEVGDEDGVCQPMTTNFKLTGINLPPDDQLSAWRMKLQEIFKRGQAAGHISSPRETLLFFSYCQNGVVHFNTTRVINCNPLDGASLSDAEVISRRQIREIITYLKEEAPEFRNAVLLSLAPAIGIRESRHIRGIARITRDDFVRAAKFPDAIARCNYAIDKHSGIGAGTTGIAMKQSDYYEIPYGCVVARDVDNLTVGGRPISVDAYIHASMRIMPCACSVGQAAGFAAAEAVKNSILPARLNGCAIRAGLKKLNAYL